MAQIRYSGRRSSVPLNIAIVGGGVAGLSTAFALQKAGHRTTILDRNPKGSIEKSGGRHVAPNAVKLLDEWGLGEQLRQVAFAAGGLDFRHHDTEESVSQNPYPPNLIHDAGAPFLFADHSDLHCLLRDLALSSGSIISYNKLVTGIDLNTNQITCSDGTTLHADLVVGADGLYSLVRRTIFPDCERGSKRERYCSSTVLPASQLSSDPSLAPLLNQQYVSIWMGPSRAVYGYPIRNRSAYTLIFHYPSPSIEFTEAEDDPEFLADIKVDWSNKLISGEVRDGFSDFGPMLSKLLAMIQSAPTSSHLDTLPLEEFHFPSELEYGTGPQSGANVVLVGHAAHPILPGATNGFGMAVEDAEVLGSLLSRYDDTSPETTLRGLLSAFTAIRHERAANGISTANIQLEFITNAPGSHAAHKRDESLKTAAEQGLFPKAAEGALSLWSYHAGEYAEEWWSVWRLPAERSQAAVDEEMEEGAEKSENSMKVETRKQRLNSVSGIGINVDVVVES